MEKNICTICPKNALYHLFVCVHLDPDDVESSKYFGLGLSCCIPYSFKLKYNHISIKGKINLYLQ